VKSISKKDLDKIGTSAIGNVYALSDLKNPLLHQAYLDAVNPACFQAGIPAPTEEKFVKQHPLLFLRDYWDRWYVITQSDIKRCGGN
jgi:hypothetical protein